MVANMPNRPGWSLTSLAPKSLQSRARRRASSTFPNQMPGCMMDSIEVATPAFSMSSSDRLTDQSGSPAPPRLASKVSRWNGGRK
jgi:hypothetical protein